MNNGQAVPITLERLQVASTQEMAHEAGAAVSTARRHRHALLAAGLAIVASDIRLSDTGRQTNIDNYSWRGERW